MEPLASKYRPSNLDDYIGQKHLVGETSPIRKFIESENLPSMIFWGPPGTGKTTLAYIISKEINADFYKLSAVMSGKDKLKEIITKALSKQYPKGHEKAGAMELIPSRTILFLDEIHRWNKSQQDALLPYVEKGIITLIGATTENPSFSLIPALLSRCRVFTLNKHSNDDVKDYLEKLIVKVKDEGIHIKADKDVLDFIANASDGDLRNASNILESAMMASDDSSKSKKTSRAADEKSAKSNDTIKITKEILEKTVENFLQYESRGEDHYNIISAVHKSLRDSDPDAGVYWITRMLEAGDDPLYIARRLLRFASEDIGNADPQAVILANTIFETCQKLGRPECDVALIQLAIYLSKAPKDNSAYSAASQAKEDVHKFGSLPVPLHIRNAPTKLMEELGYGKGYKYAHDFKDAKVDQEHFPKELKGRKYL
jgi:putative ATPase